MLTKGNILEVKINTAYSSTVCKGLQLRCVASRVSAHLQILFNGIKLYVLFCNFFTQQYRAYLAVSYVFLYLF